jgi:Flp pilus assembly protein TadG
MRGRVVIVQQLPQSSRRRHKSHLDRGAAAVEMALVMPLLVSLLLGIIDMGRLFNAEIQLSQAAREGARIASLGPPSTQSDAEGRAKAAAPAPGFGGDGSISATASMCPTNPPAGSNGTVTVTYPFTFYLPFLSGKTLSQTAVMRCGG